MKNLRRIKMIIFLLSITTILSCNNDDDDYVNQTGELIGVWQRSDVNDNFENKLIFYSDNSGYRTLFEGFLPTSTNAISNAVNFNWNAKGNQLFLKIGDEDINTPYSFNADGQLILSNITNIPFNKLE